MELSVSERLIIFSILPQETYHATWRILQNLKASLSFTEDEIKEWGITSDPVLKQTRWNVNGVADIPIGEKAMDIILESLRKLDKEGKLREETNAIYEKFIPDK
jgi:hypothetical protein